VGQLGDLAGEAGGSAGKEAAGSPVRGYATTELSLPGVELGAEGNCRSRCSRGIVDCVSASMTFGLVMMTAFATALSPGVICETVDPGPNYVVQPIQYSANYFYCFVEPEVIMGGLTGKPCGDDGSHGCHYSDKVPAMPLQALAQPVACSGGVPVNASDVASGTSPALNLAQVSLQMSPIYTDAPIYLWPTQIVAGHPVQVYMPTDTAVVQILETWAATN